MSDPLNGLWPPAGTARPSARRPRGLDRGTEERLLDATSHLVRQMGMARVSMSDVARTAGVARGTLYRYFESREVLLDAMSRRAVDGFFAEAAAVLDARPTLTEQLGAFSEMTIRSMHPDAGPPEADRASMVRMLSSENESALRRTSGFLYPYLEAARGRGEVRADLDVADASEWLARIMLSFTIFEAAIAREADDPGSVSRFVRRYAIDGLR